MKIKLGANIQGLNIRMRPVLVATDKIWRKRGKELVVTRGLDGTHSTGSLHYYGLAVDLRTRYFRMTEKALVADELDNELGPDYDVVVHGSHIHVEYDPKITEH